MDNNNLRRISRNEHREFLLEHYRQKIKDYIWERDLHYMPEDVLGERPMDVYIFSKKSEKDIDAFIKTLTDEQLDKIYYNNPPEETPIIRLMIMIRRIQANDASFENKTDEIPRAKKLALEVKEQIKIIEEEILPAIKDEDAELAIEILKVANYMYIRVFGDQMQYLKYEDKSSVEDKLKNLYDHPILKRKVKKIFIKQQLLKMDLSKSYPFPENLERSFFR